MTTPMFVVDSFTNKAFSGNPAAVCLIESYIDQHDPNVENFLSYPSTLLQKIAKEMNLSETAFVWPKKIRDIQGDLSSSTTHYDLRWFTPTVEVPLCGHATLATANVLFKELAKNLKPEDKPDTLYFNTLSGELTVKLIDDRGTLQMNFPKGNPVKSILSDKEKQALCDAFHIPNDGIVDTHYCSITKKFVVEVRDSLIVKNLKPQFSTIMSNTYGSANVRGVIITTRASIADPEEQSFDFISRYFAPWVGIDEDPVTGSAHCVLAVYWSHKLGKKNHRALQASERGGILGVTLDEGEGRVLLQGTAVNVLQGVIHL
ncbi:phenazine biosynthesis-like domain-containing protein [Planoprotostelium fungivorum]|uniref:Phenazine biosynthesis-like domain-containing protein n=1 Tax=Planoprotostelium fungivorum TaxID=1890364 RepID=A0A2P6NQF6_9EUKA|nr:phenazine biosynthesis-like domain-containing protein [Planoprotostelium fungivorum]